MMATGSDLEGSKEAIKIAEQYREFFSLSLPFLSNLLSILI